MTARTIETRVDDWREFLFAQHEAVLEQAMIFRRGDWIAPEDLDLRMWRGDDRRRPRDPQRARRRARCG